MRTLLAAAVAAALLAACKSPCLALSQKLCECETTTSAQDTCNQAATQEAARVDITDEDETRCDALLDKCDCHLVSTAQGKIDCGLARP